MSTNPWWAQRWQNLVTQLEGELTSDRTQLRGVRLKRLDITPGQIKGRVQDRENKECLLEISVATCSETQWEEVLERMGQSAAFAAQLLAGQVPQEVETLFADSGASLIPTEMAEVTVQCSCPTPSRCVHRAVVWQAVLEMLRSDPWLLFLLRGRERETILARLRQARATPAAQFVAAPSTPHTPPADTLVLRVGGEEDRHESAPLTAHIDDFWGNTKLLRSIHHHIAPPVVEVALLRRLGPINATMEWDTVYTALVGLYHNVTVESLALAYNVEGSNELLK